MTNSRHLSVSLATLLLGACVDGATETSLDTLVASTGDSSTTSSNDTQLSETTSSSGGLSSDLSESASETTAAPSSSTTASPTSSSTSTQDPVCGNGDVEGDEECDDGNDDDLDACLSTCQLAGCGDGILHESFGEECDDGNDDDDDGCNSACARDRYVFVTSTYTGGKFGAVSGANSHCKTLAQDAGLPNALTYRAWMSDDTHNPDKWFHKSKGRYLLTNGALVAHDWDDLTDGTLVNAIDVDENGEPVSGGVWTNTTPQGFKHPDSADCEGWTTQEFPIEGRFGLASRTDGEWTDAENFNPGLCGANAHFYCFEN